MNGPFVVAQATGAIPAGNPAQVIKLYKPQAGETITFHASFTGTVKIDFSAIANEKITLVKDSAHQSLHVIFADGSQLIIEPFFDSMGGPLPNVYVEVGPGQDLTGAQFAAQFPISTDQSVLPAAGPGGTPASGADFHDPSVDPLALPNPLPLLPPEELPPIQFTNTLPGLLPGETIITPLNLIPTQTGAKVGGVVEEEQLQFPEARSPIQLSTGNEDGNETPAEDLDNDGIPDFDLTTNLISGDTGNGQSLQNLVSGGDLPITFTLNNVEGQAVVDSGGNPVLSKDAPVYFHMVDANHLIGFADNSGNGVFDGSFNDDPSNPLPEGFGPDRIVFTLEVQPNGDWTLEIVDQFDHTLGDNIEGLLGLNLTSAIHATDGNGTPLDFTGDAFDVTIIDDVPVTLQSSATLVDEDDLHGPLSTGNNDVQDGDDLPTDGFPCAIGYLQFKIGADEYPIGQEEQPPNIFSFAGLNGLDVTGHFDDGNDYHVESQDRPLFYYWDASSTTLYGTWIENPADASEAASNAAFMLVITDEFTGQYKFTLLDQLDHLLEEIGSGTSSEPQLLSFSDNPEHHDNFPHDDHNDETGDLTHASAFEDNIVLDLTYTVTDFDGDTVSGTVSINIDDDVPVVLDCNLIENGSFELGHNLIGADWNIFSSITGWTQGADGVPFEIQTGGAGGLAAQDGNALVELDGDTFGNPAHQPPQGTPDLDDTNATVQQTVATVDGQFYQLTFWYAPRDNDPADGDSSSMKVLWNSNVVHEIDSTTASSGWQEITVVVQADGSSSTVGFQGAGLENEFGGLIDNVSLCATYVVDEDDIDTAWSQGTSPNDGNADGSFTEDSTGAAIVSGTVNGLVVSSGADEPLTYGFSDQTIAYFESLHLFSKNSALPENGIALTYDIDHVGSTWVLEAFEPDVPGDGNTGNPVFSFTLDENTGAFEFRLFDELIHVPPPSGSEENFDLRSGGSGLYDSNDSGQAGGPGDITSTPVGEPVSSLDFGKIITATDFDGDSTTLDGALHIAIRDDVPEAEIKLNHDDTLLHDETPGDDGNDDVGYNDLPSLVRTAFDNVTNRGSDPDVGHDHGAIGYARDTDLIEIDNDTEVGADSPPLDTSFALAINGSDGTDSGLDVTDGASILLYNEGGLIVGRVDPGSGSLFAGKAAFAIHIEDDGDISLAQWLSIKHDDINDLDESNDPVDNAPVDDVAIQQTLAGKISAVLTVTDSDGDTSTDHIDIGSRIVFEDDGPKVNSNNKVQLDDDNVAFGIGNTNSTGDDNAPLNATGILNHNYGADGPGSVSLLSPSLPSGGFAVVSNDGTTLILSQIQDGNPVNVLQITITDPATGAYQVTQLHQIDHPNDANENNVEFTVNYRVTDGDGDWNDGNIKVNVDDDMPIVSSTTVSVTVDEDDIDTVSSHGTSPDDGNADGSFTGDPSVEDGNSPGNDGPAFVSGSLTSTVLSGADVPLTFSFTGNAVTTLNGLGLESKGDALSFAVSGEHLFGFVNVGGGSGYDAGTDRLVFDLNVQSDGTYSFALHDQLDHDAPYDDAGNVPVLPGDTTNPPADQNTDLVDSDPSSDVDFINFGKVVQAVDHDGDAVSLDGHFKITITDDIPVVLQDRVCPEITEPTVEQGEPKVANFVLVLDTSGSVDSQLDLIQAAANNFLDSLGGSGAEHVRVHIVEFDEDASAVGTYDIIVGGLLQTAVLNDAKADVDALTSGGYTNYEAGLQQAQLWIEGGTQTINVNTLISSPDANSSGDADNARIIGNGASQIALVSGWDSPGTSIGNLINANGSIANGWGASPGNTNTDVDPGQMLRFDFGSFNNFGVGTYTSGGFSGIDVLSATFTLDDNSGSSSSTNFSYTIHFTDSSTQSGSNNVATSTDVTLAGTGGNADKLIDYIEFTVGSGDAGDIDLQSVTSPVTPGTIPDADVNQMIFLSDGEPNRALDNNSNVITTDAQDSIDQILGVDDASNEVGNIGADGDGVGQDQAFDIQNFTVSNPSGLPILDQFDTDGSAINITAADGVTNALSLLLASLGGGGGGGSESVDDDISSLIAVDADEPITFSMLTNTGGLTAQGLTSGSVPLTYSVVGDVLTAKAGATTVFTLEIHDDGTVHFELFQPLDHDDGPVHIDFSSIVLATDFDGDGVHLGQDQFCVEVDTGITGGVALVTAQAENAYEDDISTTAGQRTNDDANTQLALAFQLKVTPNELSDDVDSATISGIPSGATASVLLSDLTTLVITNGTITRGGSAQGDLFLDDLVGGRTLDVKLAEHDSRDVTIDFSAVVDGTATNTASDGTIVDTVAADPQLTDPANQAVTESNGAFTSFTVTVNADFSDLGDANEGEQVLLRIAGLPLGWSIDSVSGSSAALANGGTGSTTLPGGLTDPQSGGSYTAYDVTPAGDGSVTLTVVVHGPGNVTADDLQTIDMVARAYDPASDGEVAPENLSNNVTYVSQSVGLTVENSNLLIVGSNESDDGTNPDPNHTVPNPGGPLFGVINGDTGDDILVGDPGAQGVVTPGDTANIVFVLDTSASMNSDIGATTRIEAMIDGVKNALDVLVATGASSIRVHIVQFDINAGTVGTFDIMSGTGLADAKTAVDGLISPLGAGTNYEAGLWQALQWIDGADAIDPLLAADVNQLIFVSDGVPNTYMTGEHGAANVTGAGFSQDALDHVLGVDDTSNEVSLIETDGPGTDQAFTIEAVGIDMGSGGGNLEQALDILDQVEGQPAGPPHVATNITSAAELAGVLAAISGGSNIAANAGSDVINGSGGSDLIYGDVLWTDQLANDQSLPNPDDFGWQVFADLEALPSWDRDDTVQYILDHPFELSAEMPRTGGNDVITGGAGDDLIYAQEGNDNVYFAVATDGHDIAHGGSETTADIFHLDITGAGETIYLETAAAYETRTGNSYSVPTGGNPVGNLLTGNESEVILVSNAAGAGHEIFVQMTEIEEVAVTGSVANDTFVINGAFTGTALLPSTIYFNGLGGDDTLDLSGRDSAHRVVADGGPDTGAGDMDKVILDFAYSDITNVVEIGLNSIEITHNGFTDVFTNFETFNFDGGSPASLSYADLVNDQPTDIAIDGLNADSVDENSANGTVVGTLTTVDPEAWQTHSYAITGGSGAGLFNIVGGQVRVNGALNFEAAQSYALDIQSTDNGIPALSRTETFTINITDVNETPNAGADFPASAAENVNDTAVLADVNATDPDTGGGNDLANNFEDLTYSIFSDPLGKFEIDATGQISLRPGQTLNFETATSHVLTVRATDGLGLFDDVQVTINVTDVNPSTPTDSNAAANTVAEGAANGSLVGITAASTDPNGPAVTFTLSDNAGGRFAIDPTTGVVTVANGTLLDFEGGSSHNITVQASDGAGATTPQTFAIAVTDVNPSTPTDSNAAANTVAEGAANGSLVGITAASTDPNGPAVTFTLSDNAGGRFAIDPTTGVVTVANGTLLDFEGGSSHNITVQASDGAGATTPQTFAIAVTDVNPSTPTDSNAAANTVAEGAANGSLVGITAASTDPNGPAVTFTLSDNAGGRFAIDPTTGVVTVANGTLLDFEGGSSHNITVQASDGAGATTPQTFAIAVTDVNPSTPTDSNAAANTVAEGAANGSLVGITAASTDPNGPAVTFTLSDNAGGRFAIDPTTGVVTVANGTLLDFEGGSSHNITVQASDGAGATTPQTFAIAVTDVNPSTPTDSNAAANTVAEGAANGSLVGITAASTDPNGPAVTFTLSDSAGGRFAIDPTTGVVTVANGTLLDFEGATSHNITVQASDGAGATTPQTFAINVTDVVEGPTATGETILLNNDLAVLPEWLLLLNDTANGAVDVQDGAVTSPTGTTVTHTDAGNGDGTLALNFSATDGSFQYRVEDAGAVLSGLVTATLDRPSNTENAAITGTAGADILFGFGGDDSLQGAGGDDIYAFRSSGDGNDTITDSGGTADKIYIGTNGAAMTELSFRFHGSGTDDDLEISYNSAEIDIINQGVAASTVEQITFVGGATYLGYDLGSSPYTLSADFTSPMSGGAGNDVIVGDDSTDSVLSGLAGNDLLFGDSDDATNDTLNGGTGDDLLVGGGDADLFVFDGNSAALNGHDTIADFLSGTDDIFVDVAAQALAIGTATAVTATNFHTGDETVGTTWNGGGSANGEFTYNSITQELWYSANGTGSDRIDLAHMATGVPVAGDIHTF